MEQLKASALAATPGPWYCIRDVVIADGSKILETINGTEYDAYFVAQANPAAVLELIARCEEFEQAGIVLADKLEAVEKDAARYRFLRDQEDPEAREMGYQIIYQGLHGEEADRQIDVAIQRVKGGAA